MSENNNGDAELFEKYTRLLGRASEISKKAKGLPLVAAPHFQLRAEGLAEAMKSINEGIIFLQSSKDDCLCSRGFWVGASTSMESIIRQLESILKECEAIK